MSRVAAERVTQRWRLARVQRLRYQQAHVDSADGGIAQLALQPSVLHEIRRDEADTSECCLQGIVQFTPTLIDDQSALLALSANLKAGPHPLRMVD
jgi:hypothetical protein